MSDESRRGLNGLPWWAQIVSVLGFPMAVAIFLLAMFAGLIASPITKTLSLLEVHAQNEYERSRVLRVICRHNAAAARQNADDCDYGR